MTAAEDAPYVAALAANGRSVEATPLAPVDEVPAPESVLVREADDVDGW